MATVLISIEQAASLLGCATKTIRRRISDGSLPAFRMGSKAIRVRKDDVLNLLQPIPAAERSVSLDLGSAQDLLDKVIRPIQSEFSAHQAGTFPPGEARIREKVAREIESSAKAEGVRAQRVIRACAYIARNGPGGDAAARFAPIRFDLTDVGGLL